MKYLKKFENHSSYTEFKSTDEFIKPNVSHCIEENDVHYNPIGWEAKYLTIESLEDGNEIFFKTGGPFDSSSYPKTISASTDNGDTWHEYTSSLNDNGTLIGTLNKGDLLIVKGENDFYSKEGGNSSMIYYNKFVTTKSFNIKGNVKSLLYGDNFKDSYSNYIYPLALTHLFYGCTKLISAEDLVLGLENDTLDTNSFGYMFENCVNMISPPKILLSKFLGENCYYRMFYGCKSLAVAPELPAMNLRKRCYDKMFCFCESLTIAPELPATTLASSCYSSMFEICKSLTTAPQLHATNLADFCYQYMFRHCESLTIAPELPATKLYARCYEGMFDGCTSLTTAPELPATTLTSMCYYRMFLDCTSLTTAPQLLATTLTYECYSEMFQNCTSLTTAPELPATTLAERCYYYMFYGTNVVPNYSNIDFTSEQIIASGGLRGLFAGTKVTDNDLMLVLPKNSNNKYCLPATTLATYCYDYMFYNCKSLTTAPELPATTLAEGCYNYMFEGCTNLTTPPQLLATTLTNMCYYHMFYNCTNLTSAPELLATTLVSNCYSYMFYNCKKINRIKAMFTTTPSTSYTRNWVSGVASSGTFVKNAAATWNVSGVNGIPTNWTVETATA